MSRVFLSLGSNLGDRRRNLETGLRLLECPMLVVRRVSSIYETEPMYLNEQPWFYNLAAEVETELFPVQLLDRIELVQGQMGRERVVRNGPRHIDIDILLFGEQVVEVRGLSIPHPRMVERRFVLEPMAELAPELVHPVLGLTMRELLGNVGMQMVRKVGGSPS